MLHFIVLPCYILTLASAARAIAHEAKLDVVSIPAATRPVCYPPFSPHASPHASPLSHPLLTPFSHPSHPFLTLNYRSTLSFLPRNSARVLAQLNHRCTAAGRRRKRFSPPCVLLRSSNCFLFVALAFSYFSTHSYTSAAAARGRRPRKTHRSQNAVAPAWFTRLSTPQSVNCLATVHSTKVLRGFHSLDCAAASLPDPPHARPPGQRFTPSVPWRVRRRHLGHPWSAAATVLERSAACRLNAQMSGIFFREKLGGNFNNLISNSGNSCTTQHNNASR